jgi:DNA primase large subunit
MNRLHARYPFLDSAREAVEAASVDLEELVRRESSAVVERGRERVETALSAGEIGEPARQPRVELLSYPVARVLVSLLDEPMAVGTYASAEAATARERFAADLDDDGGLRSTRDSQLSLPQLLTELDLRDTLKATGSEYRIDVGPYLQYASTQEGEEWRLVDRALADGTVPLAESELYTILEMAIADRVATGLPLSVPESIASSLESHVTSLEGLLASHDVELAFERVVPTLFPPCIAALVERARDGESLPAHSSFTLVSFLAGCSLDADEIVELTAEGLDRDTVEYQLAHLRSDRGVEYVPPSCAAMQEYGDCVDRDERCDTITHPVAYYDQALEDDGERVTGWRD